MRVGLIIEYDGTDFSGSQLQAHTRTVQGDLEAAIEAVLGDQIRVSMASRTDSGVHARCQVAAFGVETAIPAETIMKALNKHLASDIRVRCSQHVNDSFDPRRDASYREYVYTLNDSISAPAIHRTTEVHVKSALDEAAMHEAAQCLVGTHDFAAFAGSATAREASTIRRIDSASVVRDGQRVMLTIRGNAFVHQQMRRTAAGLVKVGRHTMPLAGFASLVEGAERGAATDVLEPRGLCLTKIGYNGASPCGLPGVNGVQ